MRLAVLTLALAVSFGTTAIDAAVPGDRLSPLDLGTVTVDARPNTPISPNIFGTVALDAGVTAYGARWRRVSAADQRDERVLALASAAMASGHDAMARLATVHSEVSRRIRWERDLDTYRISDYWAQAGETLSRGQGDGEDIAILKMQVLKAAGFPARDIYLSIGRDRLRGADSLLLVRIGGIFYSLDDRNPAPVRVTAAGRFQPVITLGRNNAWIHGRRIGVRAAR